MTIRIHEADGTPYEHVLEIREPSKKYEVPFNTKYKRVRRNTKRFLARQAAAAAAAEGDPDALEAMEYIDLGFPMPLWEDEREREKWRVVDWTEKEEADMAQAAYEWIRIDPDFEWLCTIRLEQNEFMWISQLQRDRDVVAQMEVSQMRIISRCLADGASLSQAIQALSVLRTPVIASNLARTVLVPSYFFRVRMEAATALLQTTGPETDHLGLFYLLKIFQSRYCHEPEKDMIDPFTFQCIPRTNDFSDLGEYFIQKVR